MTLIIHESASESPLSDPHTNLRRRAVASRCLCCNASLADATSAALGVGPTCRKRLGLGGATLKANAAANELIARAAIAAEEGRLQTVVDCLKEVLALDAGYAALVERTRRRLFKIRVMPDGDGGFLISSPYRPMTVTAFRDAGLWWRPVEKAWLAADVEQRDEALAVLAEAFPEGEVLMPSGTVLALSSWERRP